MGSSIKTKYELIDGVPTLTRLPEMNFINDKSGKPLGINQHIGQRPIFASGNSDGDFEMLEWTTAGGPASVYCCITPMRNGNTLMIVTPSLAVSTRR